MKRPVQFGLVGGFGALLHHHWPVLAQVERDIPAIGGAEINNMSVAGADRDINHRLLFPDWSSQKRGDLPFGWCASWCP